MEIRTLSVDDELTHLGLEGRMDLAGAQAIELQFTALVCTRRKPALIDLSGTTFLASYGIRVLLSAAKSLRANGLSLVLLKPQPQVDHILRQASIHEIVPIEQEEEVARAKAKIVG